MFIREGVDFGGKELSIETGRMAKQADGSVLVRYGDSMVLVTAVASKGVRPGIDFMPLTVDYLEKTSAAGKIPGGYFKREGRSTEVEILTSRLIDRPCRPLFPKGWRFDTQVIATVVSTDRENPTDVLAMTGASTALHLSTIPWAGPYAGVRVGRVDGKFIVNPTFAQREKSELDFVVAASRDAIVMVEGGAAEISETLLVDALMFAHGAAQPLIDLQDKLRAAVGKPKRDFVSPKADEALVARVTAFANPKIEAAMAIREKQQRYGALEAVSTETLAALGAEFPEREGEVKEAVEKAKKKHLRNMVLDTGRRIDGRGPADIRTVTCESGVLPRTHGSALFTRGETQSLVTTTLGTKQDVQFIDGLVDNIEKRFMLHYNFPPFSTGETKPLRGASRREIGHGHLAERAIAQVLPSEKDFPYVIRIVSEILESNGSSSMASVCGGSLSLMDAGVPLKTPVAGIAMGLIKEGDRTAVLSDILGDEDHLGDMDFKVCGTKDGVTAIQMDIKIEGMSRDILERALSQAKDGRIWILSRMAESLSVARPELNQYAPRITTLRVRPEQVRDIIGPGGKTIRGIISETGVAIDVEDDGTVHVASPDAIAAKKAIDIIKGLTAEASVGEYYMGTVKRIVDFGAFVEILPGTDGLVHISELDKERVRAVNDICKEGDQMLVKVIAIDHQTGKIRLSRKEAMDKNPDDVLASRNADA
ncbi:MAG: polyribonucleotide nucleotidyltransferase [Deltaproteobacteria bacterium]|nr:polyribonucleotide nucleotidyltransferase [Deltaproteobacteria bacterium]